MTDTSSLHGFGLQGGHPCRGARCRSWTSGVSLFDWRCRKGRTGASCAGGSGSILTPATSGSAAGRPMKSSRIVRGVRIRARRGPQRRSRSAFLRCATPIRPGERARSRAALSAMDWPVRCLRRCTRFCAGMAGSLRRRAGLRLTRALRSRRQPALANGLQGPCGAGRRRRAAIR